MGIVALFVLWSGIQILNLYLESILGQMPDPKLVDSIEKRSCHAADGILNIHDLVIHNYGPAVYFATVHYVTRTKVS